MILKGTFEIKNSLTGNLNCFAKKSINFLPIGKKFSKSCFLIGRNWVALLAHTNTFMLQNKKYKIKKSLTGKT